MSRAAFLTTGVFALLSTAAALYPGETHAADFFNGKTMTLIASTGVGGGYDTYARLFGRHFASHIAGEPTIVVQNMPGAGGMRAAAYLFKVAPKDGTFLATIQATALLTPLLSDKGVEYEPPQFTYIGNLNQEYSTCAAWHTAPVKTAQDLFDKEFIVGGTGAGTAMETYPNVLNNLLGTRIKIISGYKGGSDVLLAMERGEVQGRCGAPYETYRAVRPEWLKDHKVNFILQTGLDKDPNLPGVPWLMDLLKTPEQKAILEVIIGPRKIARPVLGPPGIPAEQTKILQTAFMATAKDPAFLTDAKKQKLDIDPISGEAVSAFVKHLYATPATVRKEAADALNNRDKTKVEIKAGGADKKSGGKEEE